jgi:hypothetical protein
LITIEAPHFLQRILTTFPRTYSSAIVYFAAQAWQVIFIQANRPYVSTTPRRSRDVPSEKRW